MTADSAVPRHVWWVNQGKTYSAERAGGYIWAPLRNKAGHRERHWDTLQEVARGDIIVHYCDGEVRAISQAIAGSQLQAKPMELATAPWDPEGRLVRVEYFDLERGVSLSRIADSLRALNLVDGPLTKTGGAKQGYLWRFSAEGLKVLRDAAPGAWPSWASELARGGEANAARRVAEAAPDDRPLIGVARRDLRAVQEAFRNALQSSYLSFGARHDVVTRTFITSLATKRLVILTGLSGSGKTQIALKFGEWLGAGRWQIVAVRPDWTGPEALLGYEDALAPAKGARPAWHVPEVLRFVLQAVREPAWPFLLILDEMNLAHVERYCADVLSGIESGAPTIPNLSPEGDGHWRHVPGEPELVTFPRNLFIVGTVNVDETTYMFSPKVLDRANTIEFRVDTDELSAAALKPVPCAPGSDDLVRGFLSIAADESWQHNRPASGQDVYLKHLRVLHRLLADGDFEFGHRVFYEAVRFAALLDAAGEGDPLKALDLQVMQKMLPRLHGSRRRLEGTLAALGRYCFELTYEAAHDGEVAALHFDPLSHDPEKARLPISFGKVRRMMRNLRANQFASFAE